MSESKLPEIGNRQAEVLSILSDHQEEISGRQLRERLEKAEKQKKSLAAFYQMMARLEDAQLVTGSYADEKPAGRALEKGGRRGAVPERHYRITIQGEAALASFQEFCRRILGIA